MGLTRLFLPAPSAGRYTNLPHGFTFTGARHSGAVQLIRPIHNDFSQVNRFIRLGFEGLGDD